MNDMNRLIPKAQRKVALGSFLGLVALTAVMCAVELSSRDLEVHEYLVDVALGAILGAFAGAVLGYLAWVGLTVARQVIGAIVHDGQTVSTTPNPDGMSAS